MIVEHVTNTNETNAVPQTEEADIAISVRNVSKMYRIYDRPQDRLKQMVWRGKREFGRQFWALQEISFDIRRGEAVGIVGRNGSGKSTLLQIIAGTLAPTEGEISVSGRVAALLELGSGFNPEFTGRENVFLNGAILGFNQQEIENRFDSITSFASIGDFIDQPVKVYSSGMVLRLAFAVQAYMEPDILIVDEALSVGDIQFQHKCMRRIKELIDRGTTLLLVSHSTETVKRFCRRGLWLNSGQMQYYGEAGVAAEKYLAYLRMQEVQDWTNTPLENTKTPTNIETGIINIDNASAKNLTDISVDPVLFNSYVLPFVDYEIDLADQRLFLRGNWQQMPPLENVLIARYTNDLEALIGFRCEGEHIQLSFLKSPDAGSICIQVNNQERIFDLSHPTEHYIETIDLILEKDEQSILIKPIAQQINTRKATCWLGGRIMAPPQLVFHKDPFFATVNSEVERYGSGKARITAVELLDYRTEQPVSEIDFGQRVRLRIHAERLQPAGPRLEFSYIIRDRNRIDIFGATTVDEQVRIDPQAQRITIEFAFNIHLGPGSYSILTSFVECAEDLSQRVPMDQVDISKVFTVNFNPHRPVWYIYHEPVAINANVHRNT